MSANKYKRSKRFTENSPDRTDHAAIDAELDSVGLSVNAVIDNLALLQNDDGSLRKVVGMAQLTDAVRTELRGEQGERGVKGDKGDTGVGVQGEKGDVGASFTADAMGLLTDRVAHDNKPTGFSFVAIDTGRLYFKLSADTANWSDGFIFGKGDSGEKGEKGDTGAAGVGLRGEKGEKGEKGDPGTSFLVTSVDSYVKTASLVGRSSVSVRLVVDSAGKLGIDLQTAV